MKDNQGKKKKEKSCIKQSHAYFQLRRNEWLHKQKERRECGSSHSSLEIRRGQHGLQNVNLLNSRFLSVLCVFGPVVQQLLFQIPISLFKKTRSPHDFSCLSDLRLKLSDDGTCFFFQAVKPTMMLSSFIFILLFVIKFLDF